MFLRDTYETNYIQRRATIPQVNQYNGEKHSAKSSRLAKRKARGGGTTIPHTLNETTEELDATSITTDNNRAIAGNRKVGDNDHKVDIF